MKQLFMITLGGKAKGANIEVHDVQFIIAKNIEETYEVLKDNWYGIELKLHLDAYKAVKGVEGYKISISEERAASDLSLYFVNIGAYDPDTNDEVHYFKLVASRDLEEAKRVAQNNLPSGLIQIHVDNISKVQDSKILNRLYSGNITLEPSTEIFSSKPDWFGYRRIDK